MEVKKEHKFFLAGLLTAILIAGIVYAVAAPSITGGVIGNTALVNEEKQPEVKVSSSEDSTIKTANLVDLTQETSLVQKILKLRDSSNSNNLVATAETYNELNTELEESIIQNKWREVSRCVFDKCEDSQYLELIDSVVSTNVEEGNNQIIHDLIQTIYLWDGNNQDVFSRMLTKTNTALSNSEKTKQEWDSLLECDGCGDMQDITLKLIRLLSS